MRSLVLRARLLPALFLACLLSACGGGGGGDPGGAPVAGTAAAAPVMRCAP
ncbi:hypothetical protein ACFX58_07395 [Sphingomonas sp. NCPPB 2930]